MAKTTRPYANSKKVLNDYSPSMRRLLKTGKYNAGLRPSEHNIGKKSFNKNNRGSIPSNVLTFTNTSSFDNYLKYCRELKLKPHPARMPIGLPEFFIKFLSKQNDIVFDPFAGSNTTGAAAEKLNRNWFSVEADNNYILSSYGRFI